MNHGTAVPIPSRESRRRRLLAAATVVVLVVAIMVSAVSLASADTPDFPDVPSSHPFYAAITELASRGIIQGYTTGGFGPADNVKRQQFAKMVVLTADYEVSESDVCPFADVEVSGPGDLYPDNYVAVCAANGITVGKTATTFDPYSTITRYQATSMVVRAADDLQPGLLEEPPAGWTSSAGWDLDTTHGANAARAEYNGLLAGLDLSTLDPWQPMTRGEVAQVLFNLLGKLTAATTTTTAEPVTSTTTTGSTTTTTLAPTTTTAPATTSTTSSTTSTTLNPAAQTTYSIAGLESTTVTVTILDQFGNPYPYIEVFITSKALEGSGLTLFANQSIGFTDGYGNVAHTWSQGSGAWGVEEVTAWVDDGTTSGLSKIVAVVQWVLDDTGVGVIGAVAGQQQVTVASGYALWNGLVLKAYLNPGGSPIGSGTYVSSTNLHLNTTLHTWVSGQGYFVGAVSTNGDNKPNWMYNVVP